MTSEAARRHNVSPSPAAAKPKFVACRKCHVRKVKCPGGQPCGACIQLDCEAECTYPKRDRQVRVSESYLESILQQNQQLRARIRSDQDVADSSGRARGSDSRLDSTPSTEPSQNPVLDESPWFVRHDSFQVPLRVGEAADTAFATRVRQFISEGAPNHLPRLSYPSQDQIEALSMSELHWPSSAQVRFLVQTALTNIDKCYHVVRRSDIWTLLERFVQAPTSLNLLPKSKICALLALGELYSTRYETPGSKVPGLGYFAVATKAYGHLLERPCLDSIEVSLLLSLYSLCVNRWHSAYFLASSATRHCAVMGLNFEIPEVHLNDDVAREHLKRLWWTAYILDHTCAEITGQMVSIQDHDIFVGLPTANQAFVLGSSDFECADYISARVELVRLSRNIVRSVYGRSNNQVSFLQRVQSGLKKLEEWFLALPESLKMGHQAVSEQPGSVRSLQLLFNHSMIVTTRPLLLYLLRQKHKSGNPDSESGHIPENIKSLMESCFRCARHSHTILTDSWIDGSFKTFDYFYARYLFSTATVLGISGSLGGLNSSKDHESFVLAEELLRKLRDSGSLSAMEFYQHIEAIKADFHTLSSAVRSTSAEVVADAPAASRSSTIQTEFSQPGTSVATGPITADTALSDSSLEAFLQQNEPRVDHTDYFDLSQLEGLYWPMSDT